MGGGGFLSSIIGVVFSQGESADDRIRKIVRASKNKKTTIIVTDDKDLRFSVRALGAKVLAVKEFLSQAKGLGPPAEDKTPARPKEEEKHISKTLEYKITQEFRDIWLKRNDKSE